MSYGNSVLSCLDIWMSVTSRYYSLYILLHYTFGTVPGKIETSGFRHMIA